MEALSSLSSEELQTLVKAPALVSVLAASMDGEIDESEKAAAIKLSHLRTFTAKPALQDYYKIVEKDFESNFEAFNRELPTEVGARIEAINKELEKVHAILNKLDETFSKLLKHSLETYKNHVSKANQNVLEFFALPFSVDGLNE